jgi:hypothetical protein
MNDLGDNLWTALAVLCGLAKFFALACWWVARKEPGVQNRTISRLSDGLNGVMNERGRTVEQRLAELRQERAELRRAAAQ